VDEHAAADPAAGLEHQQQIVLSALRRAEGAPVSYAELRDAGVEFPAAVVSELVLGGVPIERCSRAGAGGGTTLGVRLLASNAGATAAPPRNLPPTDAPLAPTVAPPAPADSPPAPDNSPPAPANNPPAPDKSPPAPANSPPAPANSPPAPANSPPAPASSSPAAVKPGPGPDWHEPRVYRASFTRALGLAALSSISRLPHKTTSAGRAPAPAPRRPKRLAAPLALLAAVGLVVVVLLITLSGGGGHRRAPVAQAHPVRPTAARPASGTHPNSTTTGNTTTTDRAAAPPATPVSPALATELESRGHSLLEDGQYADAVAVLQTAVRATGESLSACVEPASSTCLTYAYALYDLGRALRLSGHPAEAVAILERRLQIDNQRPTVEAELQLARQDIG
jgi:hypothetical protein